VGPEAHPALVRILSGREKPGDAFVAVPYRDHWYGSTTATCIQGAVSFLMFLFTLWRPGTRQHSVVTIPG